jgi:hypothetical protein
LPATHLRVVGRAGTAVAPRLAAGRRGVRIGDLSRIREIFGEVPFP